MDTALSALAQMTVDVDSAMSSAILARRQIWLAQTALPEGVRAELINMPVLLRCSIPNHSLCWLKLRSLCYSRGSKKVISSTHSWNGK